MASAYLNILTRAIILFLNSWDYLLYLNYIVYLYHTWTGETEDNIPLFWFLFVSLFW